jgi:hypothetical protein
MNNEDRKLEIDRLTAKLNRLQINFQRETTEINQALARLADSEDDTPTITVGSSVEITNNYKGNRGVRGIVQRITKKRVFIQERREKRIVEHIRSFKNIRLIPNNDKQVARREYPKSHQTQR